MKRPAIFIDRDGTLIQEVNYLHQVEHLELFPFTPPALAALRERGYLIIVVTNQSGIGRGIYDEAAMNSIHDELDRLMPGQIDRFFHCPHIAEDDCKCRKPRLGMIDNAVAEFEIDLENSWLIGDKSIDVETGKAAGVRTCLVLTGYGEAHQRILEESPDHICAHLGEAAAVILSSSPAKIVV